MYNLKRVPPIPNQPLYYEYGDFLIELSVSPNGKYLTPWFCVRDNDAWNSVDVAHFLAIKKDSTNEEIEKHLERQIKDNARAIIHKFFTYWEKYV